jgi:hypothetical protein
MCREAEIVDRLLALGRLWFLAKLLRVVLIIESRGA